MQRVDSPLTRELARQRLRRDWLAERLGVKPWTFSRIEGGHQAPPPDWYARAAAILNVPLQVVLPQSVSHPPPPPARRQKVAA